MPLLNRKVDYALVILSYLQHNPEGGCARVLAGRFNLSQAFVANILKRLCREGFVTSHRGIKGGYVLQPGIMRTSLAQLMDALDDTFRLAECNRESPSECCPLFDGCPVKGPVAEVDRRIREVLGNVTLAELFGVAPERPSCQTLQLVT
jgi:Rrf2 family transcriptional regulator, cysteine metabolism repressor